MTSKSKFTGLVLSLALLAGSGGVFASQQAEYDRITDDMTNIRQLELVEPLDIAVQTREELRDYLIESIEAESESGDTDERILVLLGFIEPGVDLEQLQIDLLGEQVAGYYDPETNEMVVVTTGTGSDGAMSVSDEVTFAHETVHALQDQKFDLVAVQSNAASESSDRSLAVTALIEGDATIAQVQYILMYPALLGGLQDELAELDSTQLDSAPPYIQGTLLFPYDAGADFVMVLFNEGGWDLVDRAYVNIPQSTEQILHPEKYLDGEEPISIAVNDPLPALGDDWQVLDIDTVGEYRMQLFLDTGEVRPESAIDAAAGWGGDQLVVAGTDDELAMIWSTEWDTEEDAQEFFTILQTHELKRFSGEKSPDSSGTTFQFTSENYAGKIRLDGTNVTYVLAPDEAMANDLFANQEIQGTPATLPDASPAATPVNANR